MYTPPIADRSAPTGSIPLACYAVVAGYAFWGSRPVPGCSQSAALIEEAGCE
jgi:hypothetical protein